MQVDQRQAAMPPPDGFNRYQHQQEQARQGNATFDLPHRDSLGSVVSDQAADLQYHPGHHPDPLLQERENYKASMMAGQRFQRMSHQPVSPTPATNKPSSWYWYCTHIELKILRTRSNAGGCGGGRGLGARQQHLMDDIFIVTYPIYSIFIIGRKSW